MRARTGAMLQANSFSNLVGIPSGPEALQGSSPDKRVVDQYELAGQLGKEVH